MKYFVNTWLVITTLLSVFLLIQNHELGKISSSQLTAIESLRDRIKATEDKYRSAMSPKNQIEAKAGVIVSDSTNTMPRTRSANLSKVQAALALTDSPQSAIGLKGSFVRPNAKIGPAFRQLFELQDDDVSRLQVVLDEGSAKIAAHAEKYARVISESAEKVEIEVPAFAQEGTQVYSEVLSGFEGVLGPENNRLFLRVAGDQFDRALNTYGGESLKFTVVKSGVPDALQYMVTVESKTANSTYSGTRTTPDLASYIKNFGPEASVLRRFIKKP